MKINKNNYEIYFIDYYDGTLSAEQSAELFLFLESHPELKEEFESFSNIQLEIPELQFPDRDSLKKKEIVIAKIDEQLIAAMEGDLSFIEKQKLESYIGSNPKLKKDVGLFKATVSAPDLSIVYPDKKSLKKPVPFYIAYRNEIRLSIAAILLLGFITGTVSIFNRTMDKNAIQVAEETPVKAPGSKTNSAIPSVPPSDISDSLDVSHSGVSKEKMGSATVPLTAEKYNHVAVPVQNKQQSHQSVNELEVVEETPVQMAEVMPAGQLPVAEEKLQVPSLPSASASPLNAGNSNEHYMTVWEALRQSSEKSLKKLVAKDEPVLAYADENDESKPTLVDVVSKGLEKVSNDKVKLDTDKQSGRFSFSAGNLKIERK